MSTEWSKYLGYMTRHARGNVASFRYKFSRLNDCDTRQECSTLWLNAPGVRWLSAALLLQYLSQSQHTTSSVMHDFNFCEVTQC